MSELEQFVQKLKGVQYIVINTCYGGFGLSQRAEDEYRKLAMIEHDNADWYSREIDRDDPYLVKVVNDLGMGANGPHANLKIVEVPGDVEWEIAEYDGNEWVAEKHRTWS